MKRTYRFLPDSTGDQAKRFFTSDAGIALCIAVIWQIGMTIFGVFVDTSLNRVFQLNGEKEQISLLSHTAAWDGGWYQTIIEKGYDADPAAPVFYPLFPLAVIAVNTLGLGSIGILTAGLVVNTLSLWATLAALLKIGRHYLPTLYYAPALLFLTSPSAIFLHFFYGEAIFCAVGFWAFYFALQRKWAAMGLLLGVLTAARLPAVLFIGLCGIEFMRAYGWHLKAVLNRNLLWFCLAPLGFIAYGLFLQATTGSFFRMLEGYKLTNDWSYQVFNPNIAETFYKGYERMLNVFTTPVPFDEGQAINFFLPLLGLTLLIGLSLTAIIAYGKKKYDWLGIPLGIFGLVSTIMFTLNSNFISVNRYLLPCLTLYIIGALVLSRLQVTKYVLPVIVYTGVLLQAYLFIVFANGYFAG